MPRINLSNIKAQAEVPVGEYPARLHKVEQKTGGKAPYSNLAFKIDDDSEYKGRIKYLICSHSENSLFALKKNLLILGTDEDVVNDPDGLDPQVEFTKDIGNMCTIVLSNDPYRKEDDPEDLVKTKITQLKPSSIWG